MIALATAAALADGKPLPKICTEWTMKRTPAQIQECVKLGWQQPTTHAANVANALGGHGAGAGGAIGAIVIIALILFVIGRLGGSRKTATSS